MWYQVKAYFKFLLRSTNQHGVHSPFVYNLITNCIYNKTKFEEYSILNTYKKELLNSQQKLEIIDLGAGSQIMKRNKRSISNISKNSGSNIKRVKLLYRIVKYFNSNSILELGTSLGIGTQAMSLANSKATITTIEGCPNIAKFAKEQFKRQNLSNIKIINSDFTEAIKKIDDATFDLIFFDGNHQKEATLDYFKALVPKTHNNTIFIFDDIYWSKGMTEAWETIKGHSKVTLTIDTFLWGLVFFRKEQEKEHFTIRI